MGALLDKQFSFKEHVDYTVGRAKSVITWIKRLFETFVLPVVIIEYAICELKIWSPPKFDIDIRKIESIQKQLLIYAFRKFNWN